MVRGGISHAFSDLHKQFQRREREREKKKKVQQRLSDLIGSYRGTYSLLGSSTSVGTVRGPVSAAGSRLPGPVLKIEG